MKQQTNTKKLYKHDELLQAIDFFAQKFSINQLSSYAFEFTNKILNLNSSGLFIKEEDSFSLKKSKNYSIEEYSIEDNPKLQRIATFFGNVMTSGFNNYFEDQDIAAFNAKLVIPLIIKDLLYGFIISDGKEIGSLDEDDMLMSKALMQLINNSLESSKNLSDLQHTNIQLDQKIFNLFSINQSSRMLLSELNLNKLYSLAIDIFSELTSSRITSFGLYDDISNKIVLRGYKDVFSTNYYQIDFELINSSYNGFQVVFHNEKDKLLLKNIFKDYEDFRYLDAEYVILIVKDRVLGFVTISKPVNDRAYDQSLFELIESLAASTYISFKNAIYFDEINKQRKTIEHKLHILTNLNILIRNINSCVTIDELCDIAIKTLHYSFSIKKAIIALRDGSSYIIKNYVGFSPSAVILETNSKWEEFYRDSFVSFLANETASFFSEQLASEIGDSNCLVISPINTGNEDLDIDSMPLGYIVVLETPQPLKEEEALLIETMANSIAPVVNHLQVVTQIKQEYLINQRQAFIDAVNTKSINRDKFLIDCYVYYKKVLQIPFEEPDLTEYSEYEYYYFDNMLTVLSYDKLENDCFDGSIEVSTVEEVTSKLKNAYYTSI